MVRNTMAARQADLRLYLDVILDPVKVGFSKVRKLSLLMSIPGKPDPPPQSIMIFLKHFDTSKQTLYGVGKIFVSKHAKVGDLVPIINERMRWPETPLKLYEVCNSQS